jgi:hypothetical protein
MGSAEELEFSQREFIGIGLPSTEGACPPSLHGFDGSAGVLMSGWDSLPVADVLRWEGDLSP